jgi:ElaB/YqjD/DUF883 family membrane-anchored ribosome-binding protein
VITSIFEMKRRGKPASEWNLGGAFAFRFKANERPPKMSEKQSKSEVDKALAEAKRQATGLAREVSDATQDLYDQAIASTSRIASATQKAVHKSADSFEKALRDTVENQPYTAVTIALAVGWLLGRLHRPL